MSNINIEDLFKLPVEVRLKLVHDLWDSIASNPDSLPLTNEERQELERRFEACKNDPEGEYPWEEVEAELREHLDQRLEEYYKNPEAGSPWDKVKARLAKR